jgi:hypothetical protein
MKFRTGFISNSSTASFVVKTRPTKWDNLLYGTKQNQEKKSFFLSRKKIAFLKKIGFVPTKEEDPLRIDITNSCGYNKLVEKCRDNTLLKYYLTDNHYFGLQFLVANNISFKASVLYGNYLYSYETNDKYIYRLCNYGIAHFYNPKEVFDTRRFYSIEKSPYKKIKVKEFLKDYDEEESIRIMTGKE